MSSGICGQERPRSAWSPVQSDQGIHCLLTESLDTTECMNGEQTLRRYFAHEQDDPNLSILRKCICSKALFHLMGPSVAVRIQTMQHYTHLCDYYLVWQLWVIF